jgi:hypothetical protein
LRLITEVGVVLPDLARRATNRPLKQIRDPLLENPISGKPDRILEAFGLQFVKAASALRGKGKVGNPG